MDRYSKINVLRQTIRHKLLPLIDRDYCLLEIPDYTNVGDVLIFDGELELLKESPYKCCGMASMKSFSQREPKLDPEQLIILSGGGYFGDVWTEGPTFRRMILERYAENPIVMFPQSVFYRDPKELESTVRLFSRHRNLRLCLRDKWSYDFVVKHFDNEAFLVPDLAFYSNVQVSQRENNSAERRLLLMREDREVSENIKLSAIANDGRYEIADWPTMSKFSIRRRVMQYCEYHPAKVGRLADWYTRWIFRPHIIAEGVSFLNQYTEVISTRLHGGILSLILGKKVGLINNNNGKIANYYSTWLEDCDGIELLG